MSHVESTVENTINITRRNGMTRVFDARGQKQ